MTDFWPWGLNHMLFWKTIFFFLIKHSLPKSIFFLQEFCLISFHILPRIIYWFITLLACNAPQSNPTDQPQCNNLSPLLYSACSTLSGSLVFNSGKLFFFPYTQTHVHRVSDAIQPSHPLSCPSPPAPNPSQHHQTMVGNSAFGFDRWGKSSCYA